MRFMDGNMQKKICFGEFHFEYLINAWDLLFIAQLNIYTLPVFFFMMRRNMMKNLSKPFMHTGDMNRIKISFDKRAWKIVAKFSLFFMLNPFYSWMFKVTLTSNIITTCIATPCIPCNLTALSWDNCDLISLKFYTCFYFSLNLSSLGESSSFPVQSTFRFNNVPLFFLFDKTLYQ